MKIITLTSDTGTDHKIVTGTDVGSKRGLDVNVIGGTISVGTVTVDSEFPAASVLSDTTANPTTTIVGTFPHGFNGTTWDRLRCGGDNTDALVTSGVGHLHVLGHMLGYNGTTWDRLRSDTTNGLDVDVTRVSGTVTIAGTVTANAGTNLNTSLLALESGGNLATLAGIVTSSRAAVNLISGVSGVSANSGTVNAGTLRVTLATDIGLPSGTNNIGDVDVLTLPALPSGTNTIGNVLPAPTSSSANAPTRSVSTAYEASRVVKASAGNLYTLTGYNSKTTEQFIQIHNTASLPADTAVPIYTWLVAGKTNFSLDFTLLPEHFNTGITVCNSSTGPTKTIGSADCWFVARYS